jgi:drug/metabolite transporter (DMT)-like permease
MISLLLTILCSTSIALILKYSSVNKGNPVLLLASNYFIASAIGFILFFIEPDTEFSLPSLVYGAVLGAVFVFSFFSFTKSIDAAGTALSTLSSRISLFIPVALSIIFFGETPSSTNLIGFVFTAVTIYLFYLSLRRDKSRTLKLSDYFYLAGVMIGIGIADFSMKVFQHTRPLEEKQFFIASIFFFAFLYSFGIVLIKKIPLKQKTILSGGILGIPNVFSSVFLIGALQSIAAILVYPIVNVGVIILTAILAYLFWKERVNRLGILSLLTGLLSIIFLTL